MGFLHLCNITLLQGIFFYRNYKNYDCNVDWHDINVILVFFFFLLLLFIAKM